VCVYMQASRAVLGAGTAPTIITSDRCGMWCPMMCEPPQPSLTPVVLKWVDWEHSLRERFFFLSAFPLRDKGLELDTYPAIRSYTPACISLSLPRSDDLSCPSGPSPQLPGYLMSNCPYPLMMLRMDICVLSFQVGCGEKEGKMFGDVWGMNRKGGREEGEGRGRKKMAG
jgi:hypothetical protein